MTAAPNPRPKVGHLLPCPFCAGVGYDLITRSIQSDRGSGFIIECVRCGAQGPQQPGPNTARRDWNLRRASKP